MSANPSCAARRAAFRTLHERGCFLLPNPWDVGGALRLERMGYQAIATSSSAAAMALGRSDYQITRAEALAHLRTMAAATALPVNADFENGFADEPAEVAANVLAAAATGVAGISVEDQHGDDLYEPALAVERVRAAKQALRGAGEDVVLVARTEAHLLGRTDPAFIIDRLVRFAEAGADCLYAPGVTDLGTIRDLVRAVAPRPVNVLLLTAQMRVAELAQAGVRRVSLGGALAGAAWQAFDQVARQFLDAGSIPPRS